MTPHLTIKAFAQTSDVHAVFEGALRDRRLTRAAGETRTGGLSAARAHFEKMSSPDVLLLEADPAALAELPALASACDARTKVIIIGHVNDVGLYRSLLGQGVSEYLVAPVGSGELATAIERIVAGAHAQLKGRTYAFIGAKGGAGSSTTAQNVAWSMSHQAATDVLLADLDLAFGTADLNCNVEAPAQFLDTMNGRTQVDDALLDRLVAKRGRHLHVLTHPILLEQQPANLTTQLTELLRVARTVFPHIVLDLPNQWSPLVRDAVLEADEVVVTTVPDLCCLRNAKALLELLARLRPNDAPVKLVLNQLGMPRRTEIKASEFARGLGVGLAASIDFDARGFSTAAAAGQMMGEVSPKAAASRTYADIAQRLAGLTDPRSSQSATSRIWNFAMRKATA